MAQISVREYHAKKILSSGLKQFSSNIEYSGKVALIDENTDIEKLKIENPWLQAEKLVVKPDQLFGKRGKHGLIGLNLNFEEVLNWIEEKKNKNFKIGSAEGKLDTFIVERFLPHKEEFYISIQSNRKGDIIYFSNEGGVEIEENWNKVKEIKVPTLENIENISFENLEIKSKNKNEIINFIKALHKIYNEYNFAFLEINPFTIVDNKIELLDVVLKVDDTGEFESKKHWGKIGNPKAFGSSISEEEEYIKELDSKTGASLKLTILNPKGKIWTMVAGGGASIIYTDTISDLGFGKEISNYGEYSGDPSREFTREYAKTILKLMTKHQTGQILIIGGGIANFTDVAKTFSGIIDALELYKEKIISQGIKIYVRRGGPNYKEGLEKIKSASEKMGIYLEAYGPELHMTEVINIATKNL